MASSTGYGALAASAAQSIPIFDGDKKSFSDFDFKVKAVCLDLGLDDILLRPQEWQQTVVALQRRVDTVELWVFPPVQLRLQALPPLLIRPVWLINLLSPPSNQSPSFWLGFLLDASHHL